MKEKYLYFEKKVSQGRVVLSGRPDSLPQAGYLCLVSGARERRPLLARVEAARARGYSCQVLEEGQVRHR